MESCFRTGGCRELFNLQTTTKVLGGPVKRGALLALLKPLTICADLRSKPREPWPVIASELNSAPEAGGKSWPQLRYAGSIAPDLLPVVEEER